MPTDFTPASERALSAAVGWADVGGNDQLDLPALLLGLLAEAECRAARFLAGCGVDAAAVRQRWPELASSLGSDVRSWLRQSGPLQQALEAAEQRLFMYPRPLSLAT